MKKTLLLTESELVGLIIKIINEQKTISKPVGLGGYNTAPSDATQTTNFKGQQTNPVKRSDVGNYDAPVNPIDPQDLNTMLSFGAMFIPVVGPFLSAGISLYDAKTYFDKGDTKTAGLTAFLTLLPVVGNVINRIPGVKQLGAKGMASLASKLTKTGSGAKLTKLETQVVNGLKSNYNLVKGEVDKTIKTMATKVPVSVSPQIKQELTNIAQKGLSAAKNKVKKEVKKQVVTTAYNKSYDTLKGATS